MTTTRIKMIEHIDKTVNEKKMLTITECKYPSDAVYGAFFIGRHEIGRADKMEDGWRVFGKRKTLTVEMAAKAMIDGSISKARREESHARKMLDALRIYCGGRLPADGMVTPKAVL